MISVSTFSCGLSIGFNEICFEAIFYSNVKTVLKQVFGYDHIMSQIFLLIFVNKKQKFLKKEHINIDPTFSFQLAIQKVKSIQGEDLF